MADIFATCQRCGASVACTCAEKITIRGLRGGETVRSWHGGILPGRTHGLINNIWVWTTGGRARRVGIDVNGGLYVSSDARENRPKSHLPPACSMDQAIADLRRYESSLASPVLEAREQ